jgi:hypothetical protein
MRRAASQDVQDIADGITSPKEITAKKTWKACQAYRDSQRLDGKTRTTFVTPWTAGRNTWRRDPGSWRRAYSLGDTWDREVKGYWGCDRCRGLHRQPGTGRLLRRDVWVLTSTQIPGPSIKLQAPSSVRYKLQASSPKLQGSSFKPQATSSRTTDPS